MISWLIEVLEGDRPWTLIALLLVIDCKRIFAVTACLLVLASPLIKEYFKQISGFTGGTVEWLWEVNTLGGQVLACKDQLMHMFQFEFQLAEALIFHESSLKMRLIACSGIILLSATQMERFLSASVAWYLLLKNTIVVKDFITEAVSLIAFLHFYTCSQSHFSPNHLFQSRFDSKSMQVSLEIAIWENERKWWPAGWTSTLNRTDNRTNFTDQSGLRSYSPLLIKALKEAKMIGLEAGQCGHWLYFAGDFKTQKLEEEAETRMRCWKWQKELNLITNWSDLKLLFEFCQ